MTLKKINEILEEKCIRVKKGPRDARDPNKGYHTFNLQFGSTIEHYSTLREVMEVFNLTK